MRKCPNCDELIPHNVYSCPACNFMDAGWRENVISHNSGLRKRYNRKLRFAQEIIQRKGADSQSYEIRLSAFADSLELGFHLVRIQRLYEMTEDNIQVICYASSWAYDWDYSGDFDIDTDVYLPPSLPLLALIEVSRFLRTLLRFDRKRLKVKLVLPARNHAVCLFIQSTALYNSIAGLIVDYENNADALGHLQGCDHVLVELTPVGENTSGQLSANFHDNFNRLAVAGYIDHKWHSILRKVIMEAAENADIWGNGGWVSCYLRQEKRGTKGYGHLETNFDPARETHLFIDIFTLGPTLGNTLKLQNEREAAEAITAGLSARTTGGGRGMPYIINNIINEAIGTVFISSGPYTRIATPDGLVREFQSAGTDYLPGVHICAIVPLATVISSFTTAKLRTT